MSDSWLQHTATHRNTLEHRHDGVFVSKQKDLPGDATACRIRASKKRALLAQDSATHENMKLLWRSTTHCVRV